MLTQTLLAALDAKSAIKSLGKSFAKNADELAGAAIDGSSSTVKTTTGSGNDLVKGITHSGEEVGDVSKGTKGVDTSPPDGSGGSGGGTPPTGPPSGTPPVRRGPIPDEQPRSLAEQIVLKNAKAGGGREIIPSHLLGDKPRLDALYGPGDWVKMEAKHSAPHGKQINVHWFKNKTTGQTAEFKFKFREADKIGGVKNPGPSVPIPPGAPAPLPP